MGTFTDQRNKPRIAVCIPAKIICSDKETLLGQVTNLSEGGFYCALKKPLVPDTKIHFVFLLPPLHQEADSKSQSFQGGGVVVREVESGEEDENKSEEFALSIRFVDLDESNQKRLCTFIKERSPV